MMAVDGAPADDPNFVGVWKSKTGEIEIEDDGYVTVKKGSLVVRHAAIVRWENDRFLVRTGCCGNVSYKINQPPAQEEDQWKLILDGTEYIRE